MVDPLFRPRRALGCITWGGPHQSNVVIAVPRVPVVRGGGFLGHAIVFNKERRKPGLGRRQSCVHAVDVALSPK